MTLLSLVPTPVGNLADITFRSIEVLEAADVVAAEDTRRSRLLLAHYRIATPLVRLDDHTIAERAPALLERHDHVAFVTDAGTPGISDPGEALVKLALERGDRIEVLPGPTAFVPALVLSGLSLSRFTFEGFLPRKGSARRERLVAVAASDATSVIYESPRRLAATLSDLAEACGGERAASVSRELSKRFETTYRGTLDDVAARLAGETRGEIVIVVGARPPPEEPDFEREARLLARQGLRGRALRRALEEQGAPRNVAYRLSVDRDVDVDPGVGDDGSEA